MRSPSTGPGGITGVITSPGVLFRGGAEAEIRKRMMEDDIIDTIIALPARHVLQFGIVCGDHHIQ